MCDSIITSVCAAHPAAAHLMLWGKVQRDTSGHRSPTLYIYAREARGDRLAGGGAAGDGGRPRCADPPLQLRAI